MTHRIPKAPANLSTAAKSLWAQVWREYDLDDTQIVVLVAALEAHDRMKECQTALRIDGLASIDRFGQTRAHPLLAVERDSRGAFLRAWKQCGFDVEAPLANGRPPGARA